MGSGEQFVTMGGILTTQTLSARNLGLGRLKRLHYILVLGKVGLRVPTWREKRELKV